MPLALDRVVRRAVRLEIGLRVHLIQHKTPRALFGRIAELGAATAAAATAAAAAAAAYIHAAAAAAAAAAA
jgi:diaminopimelate epimerase